jgi:hypothetical protein
MRDKLSKLGSGHEVFGALLECSMDVQTKLITIIWVLWSERNSVNAGERVTLVDKKSFQILRRIGEFKILCPDKNDKLVKKAESGRDRLMIISRLILMELFFSNQKLVAGDS